MINIQTFGGGGVFKWDKDYFIKVITQGENPIVTDPLIVNALKRIDRGDFVPEKLKSRAYEDVDLEVGYSEKLARPTVIAQMLNMLRPSYGGKYLDIGTGTGYVAMVLGYIAGEEGKVHTIERVQYFWELARQNARKYSDVNNISFLYRDGMEGLVNQAPFDGIRIGFALEERPEQLMKQLKLNGGRMVYPTIDYYLKLIVRNGQDEFEEEMIPGFVFDSGKEGVA